MTKEDKELLLKDLCARLPYHTKIDTGVQGISTLDSSWYEINRMNLEYDSDAFLPYLRPMSSMTEEEYNEYELTFDNVVVYSGHNNNNIHSEHRPTYETFDYLDSIHVDYRDLIPKGLALEAPEDMYK